MHTESPTPLQKLLKNLSGGIWLYRRYRVSNCTFYQLYKLCWKSCTNFSLQLTVHTMLLEYYLPVVMYKLDFLKDHK